MKSIDELIRLTSSQKKIIAEMENIYLKAQKAGIAFVCDIENGCLTAYNGKKIDDCYDYECRIPQGFELADKSKLPNIFNVWLAEELCLRRK